MAVEKLKLKFKHQSPEPRAHRVLFRSDTPFKPKVVNARPRYQRKSKHPGADYE